MQKYCRNCFRWYSSTGANQCDIPNPAFTKIGNVINGELNDDGYYTDYNNKLKAIGIEDEIIKKYNKSQEQFVLNHMTRIQFVTNNGKKIYGTPSQLNLNNDCPFYKGFPNG